MTSRRKILLYGAIAFVICIALILITAYSNGVNPFAAETAHIWALSLVAALYASFRGAHIFTKMQRASQRSREGGHVSGGFNMFKRDHDIDKRMAARRKRVAAAKARRAGEDKDAGQPD